MGVTFPEKKVYVAPNSKTLLLTPDLSLTPNLFLRGHDVHGQDREDGSIHRHRRRDLLQLNAVKEQLQTSGIRTVTSATTDNRSIISVSQVDRNVLREGMDNSVGQVLNSLQLLITITTKLKLFRRSLAVFLTNSLLDKKPTIIY